MNKMSKLLKELLVFTQIGIRSALAHVPGHILGLTATDDDIAKIVEIPEILTSLISLLTDNSEIIAKQSALALIIISANNKGAENLINLDLNKIVVALQQPPKNIIATILDEIFNRSSKISDPCCMILSNLTRCNHLLDKIIEFIDNSDKNLDELVNIFTQIDYNLNGANLDYLSLCLANLSQNPAIRRWMLDRNRCVIQRLLPFTTYLDSGIRRKGVVATIKNCCFDSTYHQWLLSEEVDILPRLLLPLVVGEFDDENDDDDNDKLPLDFQYSPQDKMREPLPEILCDLIEVLMQLCSQRTNREFIRDQNTSVVLRKLHKTEQDRRVLLTCENLLDLLNRNEEEIGNVEDLKKLEIPGYSTRSMRNC